MATADVAAPRGLGVNEEATALAAQLRKLTRVATFVALLTSPPLIIWLERDRDWPLWAAILGGIRAAIMFRGLVDVRGQAEAKEEVRKVVTLWQSGEVFERAGGKRERGLLFHGPPGTGKTMLAKGIATSFNAPFISMPGSGFAQTFIGMDAVIVRWLAYRAKRLAKKWGGQCIVFIDEIDAGG